MSDRTAGRQTKSDLSFLSEITSFTGICIFHFRLFRTVLLVKDFHTKKNLHKIINMSQASNLSSANYPSFLSVTRRWRQFGWSLHLYQYYLVCIIKRQGLTIKSINDWLIRIIPQISLLISQCIKAVWRVLYLGISWPCAIRKHEIG